MKGIKEINMMKGKGEGIKHKERNTRKRRKEMK